MNKLIDRPSAAPVSDVSQDASADRASRADTGRSVIYYLVTSCCSAGFPMTYLWEPHPSSIMDLQKVKKGHGCGSGCKGPVHLMSYSVLAYFSHPDVLVLQLFPGISISFFLILNPIISLWWFHKVKRKQAEILNGS